MGRQPECQEMILDFGTLNDFSVGDIVPPRLTAWDKGKGKANTRNRLHKHVRVKPTHVTAYTNT